MCEQQTNTVQSLYNTIFGVHRNEPCYKGIILQRNNTKMTFHFMVISYNSFVKFHGKKNGGGGEGAQHDLVIFKVIYYN